jgi:hypothetical protein
LYFKVIDPNADLFISARVPVKNACEVHRIRIGYAIAWLVAVQHIAEKFRRCPLRGKRAFRQDNRRSSSHAIPRIGCFSEYYYQWSIEVYHTKVARLINPNFVPSISRSASFT